MTRRISLSILLTAWAALLLTSLAAYLATRQTLLDELDDSLISRASSLPQLLGVSPKPSDPSLPPGDRYVIRNDVGQTLARPGPAASISIQPSVTDRAFVTLFDKSRLRRITLSALVRDSATSALRPITIIYSTPADRFDRLLTRLAIVLLLVSLATSLLAAAIARKLTILALQPLHQTAATLNDIDDRHLDRRLDVSTLPSELLPIADRLNHMLEKLQLSFAQRQQFLADAAHELRTPVAALLTTLEVTLRKPRDPDALRSALQTCLTDAQLLRRLVDALLEHARGDNPAAATPPQPTDLSALLNQCADLAQTLAQTKNIQVLRAFLPDLRTMTQPHRLRSVLLNLLSNAIEYNHDHGAVEIAAALTDSSLDLTIRDTGPGIPPQHLPHVFQPFYRADPSHRPDSHLGMGLFLVQTHLQALHAQYHLDSTPTGTTFHISLPIPPSPARKGEAPAKPLLLPSPSGTT